MTIINESGLYALIFGSKLDSAKRFKHWVTSEVLPSIRKHGGYIAGQETMSDDELMARALLVAQNKILEKQKKIATLENENNLLSQQTLDWADRPLLHAIIRKYAAGLGGNFRQAWVNFKKNYYTSTVLI